MQSHLLSGLGNFKELRALRNSNPNLKISLAIGGFNEGSKKYSDLVSDKKRRTVFIESVIEFLNKHGFDGFDLDWEFPTERDGLPQDKENFAELVKELHEKLAPNFILTAAISADKKIIDKAYEIPTISKYLDYIHLMAYDYHGSWDHKVLPNAPLYSDDGANINASVSHLLSLGVPPNKLVLGLPIYGRTHILVQNLVEGQSVIGMPTKDEAFSGPYTQEKGVMGYNEICLTLGSKKWTCGWDNVSNTPYAVNEKKVIVYDDHKSLQKKVMLANEYNLGGVMMWSIDTDDFSGICGNSFQMLRIANAVLRNQQLTNIENICKTSRASYNVQSLFYVIISILVLIKL